MRQARLRSKYKPIVRVFDRNLIRSLFSSAAFAFKTQTEICATHHLDGDERTRGLFTSSLQLRQLPFKKIYIFPSEKATSSLWTHARNPSPPSQSDTLKLHNHFNSTLMLQQNFKIARIRHATERRAE